MYKIILISTLISYCYGGDVVGHGNGITAARKTKYSVDVKSVNIPSEPIKPQTIYVDSEAIPLILVFRTASSNIKVLQQHQGLPGQTQESQSEDEPDRLKHTVTKPIIQDVREIITPYRLIRQQIEPVREDINTIIARGEDTGKRGFNAGGNGGGNVKGFAAGVIGGGKLNSKY